MNIIKKKMVESFKSVFPIALIVLILSVTITPLAPGDMVLFLLGTVFLIFGMSLFTMGAEMSMQHIGTQIGESMAKSGKIWLITFVSFIIGILITVSEPDLQILAEQVPAIDSYLLIITVSVGVGIFLAISLLRAVFGISLQVILLVFYAAAFVLSFFLGEEFRPLAFDSGGVTTGPMTVPFIMALGAGVSSVKTKKSKNADSFGMTALCSIGPIISVMVLGVVMKIENIDYKHTGEAVIENTREGLFRYADNFLDHAIDVLIALLPIVVFTVLFQLVSRAFTKHHLIRIGVGLLYVFVGLAIFLTGANVGFVPTGATIGRELASIGGGFLLIPIGMLLGYFIVKAEPAVYVLNHQVEEMSAGAISGKTTGLGLSIGVSAAIGLSALRIVTGLPIMYVLVPGYIIAFALTFFVPKVFIGVAFDSGGVASGTMMSGFVLPLAIGACMELGGNVMADAFGCVSFVAMAPIISIQMCGLVYSLKSKQRKRSFISRKEVFVEYSRPDAQHTPKKIEEKGEEQKTLQVESK